MEFAGKKILITGSTRGIGAALAQYFLNAGAVVVINGRASTKVDEAVQSFGKPGQVFPAAGDLSSAAGCDSVVEQALSHLGALDILINNAGIYPIASIEDTDEAMWDDTMSANVKSAFFCTRAALSALRASKGSRIASDGHLQSRTALTRSRGGHSRRRPPMRGPAPPS